jgi:hypothetical protein
MEWVFTATPRPHYPRGKDSVPFVQGAEWAPGPVRTGEECHVPTGIRSLTVQLLESPYTD